MIRMKIGLRKERSSFVMKRSRVACVLLSIVMPAFGEVHGPFVQVGGDAAKESVVCWLSTDEESFELKVNGKWQEQKVRAQTFGDSKYTANRVVLNGLATGESYTFRIGQESFTSKTMPEKAEKLVFAVGGDMMHKHEQLAKTTRQMAKRDPDFAVYGGDLAYANGSSVERWPVFLDVLAKEAVDKEGHLIPAIVCIGNHEVKGGYNKTPKEAPYSGKLH